ncbi:MAG: hypothetical protein MK320_13820, partial [Gammaproteobacteria bacterium]|nr:hypothetical protein [Gammaproteobacteria bacterium]
FLLCIICCNNGYRRKLGLRKMSFCDKREAVIDNKDTDAMVEFMHPGCTMVPHSTGEGVTIHQRKESS